MRGDLARLAEVRDAADAILARCPEIHLLWNNAGIVKLRRELTADGFEAMFGVNHLAYFVMTGRLRSACAPRPARASSAPLRKPIASAAHSTSTTSRANAASAPSRPTGAPSSATSSGPANSRDDSTARASPPTAYHPGGVATRLGQTDASWTRLVGKVIGLFMLTPEQGASTGVFLATAPEVANVSGRYFAKSREKKPAAYAQDDAAAKRLWDVSEKLVAGLA